MTRYDCFRCGTRLELETQIKDYKYFCPNCDENMFTFEAVKVLEVKRKIKRYKRR